MEKVELGESYVYALDWVRQIFRTLSFFSAAKVRLALSVSWKEGLPAKSVQ
jgi:hypothetical protein